MAVCFGNSHRGELQNAECEIIEGTIHFWRTKSSSVGRFDPGGSPEPEN